MTLRPKQTKFVADVGREFRAGAHSLLGVAPCGFGKTRVMCHMSHEITQSSDSVVLACFHREELLYQTSAQMNEYGIAHGLHSGNNNHGTHSRVQLATIQTALNRQFRPKWLFFDEAHLSKADSWTTLRERYAAARLLGLSATPTRLDGKGFGDMYNKLVLGPTTREMIEDGLLVPGRYFAPSNPDLSDVHNVAGEYNQKELSVAMQRGRLIGEPVEHWKRIASKELTLLFAVNRQHSKRMADEFKSQGIAADHIDGTMSKTGDEYKSIMKRFRAGKTRVLCSVLLFTEGFDVPEISCIIDLAPTQSLAKHRQKYGRGFRLSDGKLNCIFLDHAGNLLRHGFPDDDIEWTLDPVKKKRGKDAALPAQTLPRVCPECFAVLPPLITTCPCGYVFAVSKSLDPVEGQLSEITDRAKYRPEEYGDSDDPAVQAIIKRAKSGNFKPGYVHVMTNKLEEARARYRDVVGKEPKPHWNEQSLKSMADMVERAA